MMNRALNSLAPPRPKLKKPSPNVIDPLVREMIAAAGQADGKRYFWCRLHIPNSCVGVSGGVGGGMPEHHAPRAAVSGLCQGWHQGEEHIAKGGGEW